MTAQVYNIRDYQSKSAIERAHKALEEHLNEQAIEIANIAFPSVIGFGGIDDLVTEQEPA